jgi:hypothetical protein
MQVGRVKVARACVVLMILVVVAALSLAACGDSDSSSDSGMEIRVSANPMKVGQEVELTLWEKAPGGGQAHDAVAWSAQPSKGIVIVGSGPSATMLANFPGQYTITAKYLASETASPGDKNAQTNGVTTVVTVMDREGIQIFNNGNTKPVKNGGTPPTFSLNEQTAIIEISTYHLNGGRGAPPGTILLEAADGTRYGPWQAKGAKGEGGVKNAVWTVALVDVLLAPGDYRIIDSDPGTWSQNAGSQGHGFAAVRAARPGE